MSFNASTTSFSSSPLPVHSSSSSSSSWQNINPSILTAILVLSITVIVSTSICLLIRYITQRFRHRYSNTATVSPAVSQPPSSRRVAPETQDLSLLNSLPLFSFNSVTNTQNTGGIGGGGGDGNSDCAVCLSKFEPHDQLRLLPVCCHAFHADCVDTWLQSNQTCPLCRSQIFISDSEILGKILRQTSGSFRIEIGSVSRRQGRNSLDSSVGVPRSYSIGSFDYIVQDDSSEVDVVNVVSSDANKENQNDDGMNGLAEEVGMGSSRRWLRDYVDRFSSSFRSSGRFFGGSSRRHNVENLERELEVNRAGEEISEFFRWLSAV